MAVRSQLKTAFQVHQELSLEAAIHEVKNGQSQASAAKIYRISRTTLRNRLQNSTPSSVGAPTKFASHEEDRLAEFFLACSDQGVPLNRYHCLQIFSEVAIELGMQSTTFNDAFFNRFISRHPDVSLRITHASNRKKDREWTTELCEEYISRLRSLFDRGFLERPEQVWNLDETAFDTSEMYDRVVARKGVNQIPSQFDGNEKECVTILPCGNAAGVQLKFMALYAGKVHVQSRLDDTFGLCYHAVNSSGYMDTVHFANYIRKEVFPAMNELKSVIFLDGHYSHVNNLRLIRYCKQFFEESGKQVEIFCLPSGQTSHLQPFDVSAFGGVKKKWKMYLRDRKLVKGGRVTKDNLLSHVVKLWYRTEGCTERYAFNVGQSLQSGFAKTGLFPFSPEVIRQTVKLHHDPQIIERGIRREIQQDFGPLINILKDQYNISAEKDLEDIKEFIQLKQKGITPGAVLANVMQKDLFGEAPKKQRRQVNRQLNTEPGALITGPEFVAELEKEDEKKKAEKAAVEAKRKAAAEKKKENATKEKDESPTASKRKASNVKSLTSKKARV
ncbi:hypothetical protein RvY_01737 [Ramazzottius varieornatus]|uniref:HTH psq-type domain-containing protein n=1 Tax=Ramazzottius varieornatus TaxID=947166 RepID=A0A1D1US21_RAMVA|nr:hypothetical protein RvY_01737 [Ramazzottius varieornatus]